MNINFAKSRVDAIKGNCVHPLFYTRRNPLTYCVEDIRFNLDTGKIDVMASISLNMFFKLRETPQFLAFRAGEQIGVGVFALNLYGTYGPKRASDIIRQLYLNIWNRASGVTAEIVDGEDSDEPRGHEDRGRDTNLLSLLPSNNQTD